MFGNETTTLDQERNLRGLVPCDSYYSRIGLEDPLPLGGGRGQLTVHAGLEL